MTAKSLYISNVYMPGSLSLNNIYILASAVGTTARSVSFSFGLYSISDGTLSLANSASRLLNFVNGFSWVTLATSATQDITPGNWYFAFLDSSSSQSYYYFRGGQLTHNLTHGGPPVYGVYSVSTGGLPSSIATNEIVKPTTAATGSPCSTMIIISA